MHGITFTFSRSAAQEADLRSLMAEQANPASPQFRQWLTPEQFGARFGVPDSDLAKVEHWIERQGFKVDGVSRSRNRLAFSGNAGQVAQAFGTSLHRYRSSSGDHFAAATELSLPAEMQPLVEAVLHLSDFRPKPEVRVTHVLPQYTTAQSQTHYLDPTDIAVQYNFKSLYAAGHRGIGQSIAVVGQSSVRTDDYTGFSVALGLGSASGARMVLVPGSGVEAYVRGDEVESDIDLEYSGTIAPGANQFFVFTGDNPSYNVYDALRYAVTEDVASIISISYGSCESEISASEIADLKQIAEQANVQGQTLIAASGDLGSNGCFYDTGLSTAQRQALAVSVPASLANVTAIGGLQLATGTFSPGDNQYFAAASGSDLIASLESYVPETVWNEDSTLHGRLSSGGGTSSLIARPDWQTGVPGINAGAFRLVPDLALQSSTSSPGFIFCSSDPSTFALNQVNSCYNGTFFASGSNSLNVAGGTSFAAPIFAGMLALLNEATNNAAQGNINPTLYSLAASTASYSAAFHDITSGGNQCNLGSTACSSGALTSYLAAPGYDQASGLGSIDLTQLVSIWPKASSASMTATRTDVGIAGFTLTAGSQQQASVSVGPATIFTSSPTGGTLKILLDGQVIQAALPVSFGFANFSFTTPASSGSHVISALYSGDGQFGASRGTAAFDVGNLTATGSFSLAGTNISLPANGTGTSNLTVTPNGGYNGLVTFSVTSSSTSPALCYRVGQLSTYSGNAASIHLTLGAGTACSTSLANAQLKPKIASFSGRQPSVSFALNRPGKMLRVCGGFAGFLLCTIGAGRRKRLATLVSLACLSCSLGLMSCGGSSASADGGGSTGAGGGGSSAPTSQAVTLTVIGTDSIRPTATASTTLSVTVGP